VLAPDKTGQIDDGVLSCGGRPSDAIVEHFLSHDRETSRWHSYLALDRDCFFAILLARRELAEVAYATLARAQQSMALRGATEREALYVKALSEACMGGFVAAIAVLEMVLAAAPADGLAAKLSHALRFMLGDARGCGNRLSRCWIECSIIPISAICWGVAPSPWRKRVHWMRLKGSAGAPVDRAPRDAWGLHAVSHIREMIGRAREGAAFLEANEGAIAHCNNFTYSGISPCSASSLAIGRQRLHRILLRERLVRRRFKSLCH
jgi:hypothetical protein